MDPLTVLSTLGKAIKYLYDQAQKTKENSAECTRLATHANAVYDLVSARTGSIAPDLAARLEGLCR